MNPLKISRIVDLSQSLYPGMPSWPTLPDLRFEAVKKAARDVYTINVITQMHMHIGTHVDVPLHSIEEGKSVEQYSIERYVGEGVVLDFTVKKPAEEITGQDLLAYSDSIKPGDVVMLCTDWSKQRGLNSDYLYKWPYLGITGCRFLLEKKVKAVGTEGMSIAGWTETVAAQGPVSKYSSVEIHNMFLEKDIIIIEGLSNLSEVLADRKTARVFFAFAPLNFVGAEGAPCRAMAFDID